MVVKLQVMVDENGDIVATGPFRRETSEDGIMVELVPLPGQNRLDVEVGDELASIEDVDELYAKLQPHLRASARDEGDRGARS
jgi:hypothetical protein